MARRKLDFFGSNSLWQQYLEVSYQNSSKFWRTKLFQAQKSSEKFNFPWVSSGRGGKGIENLRKETGMPKLISKIVWAVKFSAYFLWKPSEWLKRPLKRDEKDLICFRKRWNEAEKPKFTTKIAGKKKICYWRRLGEWESQKLPEKALKKAEIGF